MGIYTAEVELTLNNLLIKIIDAEKGFLKAAKNSNNSNLKTFFAEKSKERYDFGYELKEEIKKIGQSIEKDGSTTATVHRAWMDIKSAFSLDTDVVMLEEALNVEENLLHEYEVILGNMDLPPTTSEILTKQKNIIIANLKTVKVLADVD